MKLPTLILSLLCFSISAAEPQARSDSERKALEKPREAPAKVADPTEFNLHFELLVIALPSEEALLIIEQMQNQAGVEAAYSGLLRKLPEAKAKVLSLSTVVTKSGNQAMTENVDEVRYPIEFDAPRLNEIGATLVEKPEGEAKPDVPPPVAPVTKPEPTEKLAAIPVTFETRNVGVTFQIEPTLDPRNMQLHIQVATQRVVFKGMEKHSTTVADTTAIVEQPRFAANKVQTQLTLRSGNRILLGAFKAPDLEGWTELHILRASAEPLK